jgi:phytoene synthase
VTASHAYRHCERIVRTRARNFSYGIRLLQAPKRRALSAVYAFARRIDDIGDADGPAGRRLALLAASRRALNTRRAGNGDLVLVALFDAARRYPIPLAAFEELLAYCRRVAGSVGRLSLGVFGSADLRVSAPLADALGVALQLTNILRDVHEDRLAGRVYLPAEDLERFRCTLELDAAGRFTDPPHRLDALMRFQAARARDWYAQGMRLPPLLDRRSAACTAAMAGIYRGLLDRIAACPAQALAGRSSLPAWEKAMVAARALAGAGR